MIGLRIAISIPLSDAMRSSRVARPLNCNAEMYSLESRVMRNINGRAAHSIFRNGATHHGLNFLIRFSAQAAACAPGPPARVCSTTRAPDTASTHPLPARRQCGRLGCQLLSVCQKIVGDVEVVVPVATAASL